MVGRPRGTEDAAILRAAAEVIGRIGPARFTLAAVATEVGLVPATLVQRFGSKRGLLLALARQSAADADTGTGAVAGQAREAREQHGSALAALTALAVGRLAPMTTPDRFANHLAFLCLDLTDPELYEPALAVHQAHGRAITALVEEAIATGELRAGTPAGPLTSSIQAVIAGAGLTWALDREGTLPDRVTAGIGAVLAAYLPADGPAGEEN
ncbi:MAG TPA: helix-turn-helix domain-containing protein [Streptosporangiaceae bacterium]